ncbi:MAG: hypothetical protein ABI181_03890 [Mycobacteriaceae bacterium]
MISTRPHVLDPTTRLRKVQTSDAVLRASALGVAGLLVAALVLVTPATLWAPSWLVGPLVVAGAVLVIWWALSRPWSVLAVPDDPHVEVERRVVTGALAARRAQLALVRARALPPAPGTPDGDDPDATDRIPYRR